MSTIFSRLLEIFILKFGFFILNYTFYYGILIPMNNAKFILDEIKTELKQRMQAVHYLLWIDELEAVTISDSQLIILAPSENVKNTVEKNHLYDFIEAGRRLSTPIVNFEFITKENLSKYNLSESSQNEDISLKKSTNSKSNFIARYTFDNFVVGESNRLAFVTARTVAENPGINDGFLTLNPLFIYGGVGLGKTHLLHSIGNYILENNPACNVVYMPTEKLTNEYFASLNKYSTDKDAYRKFREKYANADVLMLDDIQFLQKKGGLQDVIFHIFNDLYDKGKQIILSSDRPPKEINDIEDRLRSRFEGGIMTDIWTPSLDTRIEIILKKLEGSKTMLDEDIVYYLAEKINTNIRELEGALLKVIMYSTLTNTKPSLALAKEALKEKDEQKKEDIDSEKIISVVSDYFNISKTDIIGKKKNKEIVEARMVAIYLVYDILNLPLINIGQIFGGRDHTTIIYSRDKIMALISNNTKTTKVISDLKEILNVNN